MNTQDTQTASGSTTASVMEMEQRDSNTAMVVAILRLDNTLRECTDRIVKRLDDLDISLSSEIESLERTVR